MSGIRELARRLKGRYPTNQVDVADLVQQGELAKASEPNDIDAAMRRLIRTEHTRGRRRVDELPLAAVRPPGEIERARVDRIDLCRSIRALGARRAGLVRMYWWDGYTDQEIGRMLGIPAATIRLMLASALKDLRWTLRAGGTKGDKKGQVAT